MSLSSAETFARDYERLRTDAASFWLDDWALIELTGDDRLEWLQGQATNDVRDLTPGRSLSFCFCEPTGQILAPIDAWALDDRILMTVPLQRAGVVLTRVVAMTILEDVLGRNLTDELDGLSIQGPLASVERLPVPRSTYLLPSDRLGDGGFDAWIAAAVRRVPNLDPLAYEAARIEAGLPKWNVDLGSQTLPAEMGPAFEAKYVSYSKGCYTGQEVLMRMHARGHTNKTWVGLVAEEPLSLRAEVSFEGKSVGAVSSAAPSPTYGWVGAATLRNEATMEGTKVRVGNVEAEVRTMPIRRAA